MCENIATLDARQGTDMRGFHTAAACAKSRGRQIADDHSVPHLYTLYIFIQILQ